jgi:hypothetical protein
LNGLFKFAASGIPGVGEPPGEGSTFTLPGAGIPGVEFAEGGIGLADIPSGILFGSRLVATFEFAEAPVLALTFTFAPPTDPHAVPSKAIVVRRRNFVFIQ